MKVYVVTSGTYSDYSIEAVFLDREKAEAYVQINKYFNGVEEYDTKDEFVDTEPIVYEYECSYYPESDFFELKSCVKNFASNVVMRDDVVRHTQKAIQKKRIVMEQYMIRFISSKLLDTETELRKIFFDKLAKYKAENEERRRTVYVD